MTVTMRADAPGSLGATATVSADQADPTPANNGASDTTNVELTSCSGVSFSGPHVFQAIDPKGAPLELAHGDFNEDGFVDVVESIQERGGGVALLLNNGTGGLLDGTFFQLTYLPGRWRSPTTTAIRTSTWPSQPEMRRPHKSRFFSATAPAVCRCRRRQRCRWFRGL